MYKSAMPAVMHGQCPRAAAQLQRTAIEQCRPWGRACSAPTERFNRMMVRSAADEEFGEHQEVEVDDEEGDFTEMEDDSSMRLFLDSADVAEWQRWAETGLFFGFTTNPTILRRDRVQCTLPSMRQLARQAFELDAEELQLQAWGASMADLYSCGLDLYELDPRIVVKVPITLEGLNAARRLIDDGVPVTLTGLYSAHQAVTALAAGATYAAPYLGRMNDAGKNGLEELSKMQSIVELSTAYNGEMRLLVASICGADEIAALAAEGCNTFTISPEVARQLVEDPLTVAAAKVFQEHAAEMGATQG